mmetsp:Transcript_25472/g.73669  ORF Transcript_25472/g.73669 Transcript_25472/m.73669 type:complete len:425 (+) Transcript_25472:292-1566(+)|eukprot:CAMPEP_0181038624 /NCGR_PEP_ID=MMETSP1070-20121207/10030_1 /TAXON_ID=265543 /ORGANISM="Minutocellus polymorphus, Strain NH13" /LENGTH=424 /DNA_ID=CAMNT_0023116411 /DNA_START=247 /DNA_END=1521 /DNA_ORIENTATION=-
MAIALAALYSSGPHRYLLLGIFLICYSGTGRVNSLSTGPTPTSFGSVLQNDILSNSNTPTNNKPPRSRGWQYWCDNCSCGFNKKKSFEEHNVGKGHILAIRDGEKIWEEYAQSGEAFYDEAVAKLDVTRAWSLDGFMEGLQARSRSSKKQLLVPGDRGEGGQIDPNIRLCDLVPAKRAALYRYLHVSSSGVPGLVDMISALPSRYVRVKELLESVEVFFHVERLMKRSTVHGQKAKRLTRVHDIGCGHGLVGILIASAYPHIAVHSIDLVPRESFLAQRDAFRSTGALLDNLTFEAGDLSVFENDQDDNGGDATHTATDVAATKNEGESNDHTLVLCVHGCKELTHESIELAQHNGWAWLVLPCCLQAEDHLDKNTSLHLKSDSTRFAMLCGAIAANYRPEIVSSIASIITARGIVLASSGQVQ